MPVLLLTDRKTEILFGDRMKVILLLDYLVFDVILVFEKY